MVILYICPKEFIIFKRSLYGIQKVGCGLYSIIRTLLMKYDIHVHSIQIQSGLC